MKEFIKFSFSLSHPLFPTTYLTDSFPWLLLSGLAILFLINTAIFLGSIYFFGLHRKKPAALICLLWLIDILGYIVVLLFTNLSFSISETLSPVTIHSAQLYTPSGGVGAVCIAILLATSLIYWLALTVLKKQYTLKQSSRLALTFALFTAPYVYLVPLNWFH